MLRAKVEGHNQLRARLQGIRERMVGVVSSDTVMSFMERRIKERFKKGVDEEANPWPKLSPLTVKKKGHALPLQRTRTLLDSIAAVRQGNAGYQTSTNLGFRIGVLDPEAAKYGRLHDQGIGQKRRRFFGLGTRDAKALTDLMLREMRRVTR